MYVDYAGVGSLPVTRRHGSKNGANYTLVTSHEYSYDVMSRTSWERNAAKPSSQYDTLTYAYDWRSRNTGITGPAGYYLWHAYDNLDRMTATKRRDTGYQGTIFEWAISDYDEMGRVYRTEIVNPAPIPRPP